MTVLKEVWINSALSLKLPVLLYKLLLFIRGSFVSPPTHTRSSLTPFCLFLNHADAFISSFSVYPKYHIDNLLQRVIDTRPGEAYRTLRKCMSMLHVATCHWHLPCRRVPHSQHNHVRNIDMLLALAFSYAQCSLSICAVHSVRNSLVTVYVTEIWVYPLLMTLYGFSGDSENNTIRSADERWHWPILWVLLATMFMNMIRSAGECYHWPSDCLWVLCVYGGLMPAQKEMLMRAW